MPQVREAYREARRKQIIDAAYRCFAEKGFQKTTVRDICGAANLSVGAVYNYFRSKDDIIAASGEEDQRRIAEMISSAAAADPEDPLGNLVRVFLPLANEPEFVRDAVVTFDLCSQSSRDPEIAEGFRKTLDAALDHLVEPVKRQQKRGVLNAKLDPYSVAAVLVAVYQGFRYLRVFYPEIDVDAFGSVCEAMVRGISA
ncbi:MAG: TetR/AcrR family transcriptional regulator, partial [Dehalococcoidia bacterium]|nr:TetR/AcrR family transcriptional regulator [Dehalococcoidia bacterium]